MAQLFAMMAELNNTMVANIRTLRGETQSMGLNLQAGRMATPHAGANEQRGSEDCVGLAGEDEIILERLVKVTEEVTVTQREKLNGGDGDVHETRRDEGDHERGDGNKMYRDTGDRG